MSKTMKKGRVFIVAPPAAFLLAAVAGWITNPPADHPAPQAAGRLASREHRPAHAGGAPQTQALQALERAARSPSPPTGHFDRAGMEAAIAAAMVRSAGPLGFKIAPDLLYAHGWACAAPAEMFAWLSNARLENGPRYSAILFQTWAARDLPTAQAAALELTDPALRQEALMGVLGALALQDPPRARKLFAENFDAFLPDGQLPNLAIFGFRMPEAGRLSAQAIERIMGGQAPETSPNPFAAQALDLLAQMPASPKRTRFIAGLLEMFAAHQLSEPAREVWEQAPASFREELVAAGFSGTPATADRFAGLEALARQHAEVGSPQDAKEFLDIHGPRWAARDLPGALAWARAHLRGRTQYDQCGELLAAAAAHDFPAAAAVWRELPAGSYLKYVSARRISEAIPADRNDPEILREAAADSSRPRRPPAHGAPVRRDTN